MKKINSQKKKKKTRNDKKKGFKMFTEIICEIHKDLLKILFKTVTILYYETIIFYHDKRTA